MLSASKSGSGLATGYNLTRSLRFRASATATLSRTFSTPTSNQKMTLSCWVKLGSMSQTTGELTLLTGGDGTQTNSTNDAIQLRTNGTGLQLNILCKGGGTAANGGYRTFAPLYRDYAGWYHVVLAVDTTQASAANRYRGYVNGVELTSYTGTDPNQNVNLPYLNTAVGHFVGKANEGGGPYYTDAYLAEQIWVDGQQLTPSSFGSTNALTGVWQPAAYTGSYGTNGFYLPFTDNSALTTSSNVGLGKDFSGNANYWVTNNISITSGVTYDSMTDVPTLTSATAANFAVLNPLSNIDAVTLNGGNLNFTATGGGTGYGRLVGTIAVSSGKWYWEYTINSTNGFGFLLGIALSSEFTATYVGNTATSYGYYGNNGNKYNNGTGAAYGAAYGASDVIGVALDLTAGTLTFYKNNVSQGTAYSSLTGTYVPAGSTSTSSENGQYSANFGQRPFTYTPPTGFVALNTYNLPTSTIVKGNTVMDATLYTGTLLSNAITNAASFKPDLVWVKSRSAATSHKLTDSVRGTTKALIANSTNPESTDVQGLTAFNTNGFTVGTDTNYNNLSATYVGWQWQAGQGSTSSNTNGSITSTVSVNASAGFSVVTYTGTGAAATVGHGLGVAPSLIIVKGRTNTSDWRVYHASVALPNVLNLNTSSGSASDAGAFGSTAPTSSVFTLGTGAGTNGSANTYVAYCWAAINGFSAFGSYTGNNSNDGPFAYLGFRPKFVMFKASSIGSSWIILDSARDSYNVDQYGLATDNANAESTYSGIAQADFLSNGFKIRANNTNIYWNNSSGSTVVYMAWAENPFKNALAR